VTTTAFLSVEGVALALGTVLAALLVVTGLAVIMLKMGSLLMKPRHRSW